MTKLFMGKPCKKCGGTERYASNKECLACQRVRKATAEHKAQQRDYDSKPANKQRRAERDRRRLYDLLPVEYNFRLAGQGFCCAACGTDAPGGVGGWHVDHCHDTGKVRGILCQRCNNGIGKLGDNAAGLRRAIAYLERFECQTNSTPPTSETAGRANLSPPIAPNAKPQPSLRLGTSSQNFVGQSRKSVC